MRRSWRCYYRDLRVGDVVMMHDGPKVLVERKAKKQHSRTYGHRAYTAYVGVFFHVPSGTTHEARLGNAEIHNEVVWATDSDSS